MLAMDSDILSQGGQKTQIFHTQFSLLVSIQNHQYPPVCGLDPVLLSLLTSSRFIFTHYNWMLTKCWASAKNSRGFHLGQPGLLEGTFLVSWRAPSSKRHSFAHRMCPRDLKVKCTVSIDLGKYFGGLQHPLSCAGAGKIQRDSGKTE